MRIEGKLRSGDRISTRGELLFYSDQRRTLLDDGDVLLGGDHLEKQMYVRFGETKQVSRLRLDRRQKRTLTVTLAVVSLSGVMLHSMRNFGGMPQLEH